MSNQSSGISVVGLLGVVFVALKLTGFIDWSWWWVTLPFWGGFGIVGLLLFVYFFLVGLCATLERKKRRK